MDGFRKREAEHFSLTALNGKGTGVSWLRFSRGPHMRGSCLSQLPCHQQGPRNFSNISWQVSAWKGVLAVLQHLISNITHQTLCAQGPAESRQPVLNFSRLRRLVACPAPENISSEQYCKQKRNAINLIAVLLLQYRLCWRETASRLS